VNCEQVIVVSINNCVGIYWPGLTGTNHLKQVFEGFYHSVRFSET
jgi:hypothetical protein